MPLLNENNQQAPPLTLVAAYTWVTRMVGLLHRREPESDVVLHLKPCKNVHTFGMRFPIDIVALDRSNQVMSILTGVGRNRIVTLPRLTHSILEGAPGWAASLGIQVGHRLQTHPDRINRVHWDGLRHLFHWPLNLFIAVLWSRLVFFLLQSWQQQQQAITLGILIHNTLLLILFLTRRESRDTSTRPLDWLVPFATITCAMLLRPAANNLLVPPYLAVAVQGLGLLAMVFSLISLGRSFGVVPAHRELKLAGAYKLVRHPLYTSEMVFYLGFLLGHATLRNATLVLCIFAGQFWRAAAEERLLQKDEKYKSYLRVVRYRFLPGLY